MRKEIFILALFVVGFLKAQYYVTPSGNSSNDGLSEANAWSLTHADGNVPSGSTVNVKVGNYGSVLVNLLNDNVKWSGYNTTPNDISPTNTSSYNYPNAIDNSLLPTLNGADKTGIAVTVSGNGITLENFQVVNFERGVRVNGNNVILRNIVTHDQGFEGNSEVYNGIGIEVRGASATVLNSHVQNAGAEGLAVRANGSNSIVDYCTVISDRTTAQNGTDYFIALFSVNNCVVTNCSVRQINDTNVGRHGFVIKDAGSNNLFKDSTTENVNCEANFELVANNTWESIAMTGTSGFNGVEDAARIRVSNGAHDNKFINVSCTDCWTYVGFADWDDGLIGPGNAAGEIGMGNDNVFINSVANNVKNFITYEAFETSINTTAEDNTFISPTINNAQYLFRPYKVGNNTKIVNAIVNDVSNFEQGGLPNSVQTNTVFENINVTNSFNESELTPFIESNITTLDFSFVNSANGDFNINSNVLNIGQNASVLDADAGKDFQGLNRIDYTLGAYEFINSIPQTTSSFFKHFTH